MRGATLLAAVVALAASGLAAARADPVSATGRVVVARVLAPGGRVSVLPTGLVRPVRVQQRIGGAWVDRGPAVTAVGGRVTFRAPPPSRAAASATPDAGSRLPAQGKIATGDSHFAR